jgi:transposase-like protein
LHLVKISHLGSIWNWILLYPVPKKLKKKKKNIEEYSCIRKDETAIKAGSELIRLWIAII